MAFHATYSAREVLITYLGVDLSEGKADDTFMTVSDNSPRTTMTKGADGNTAVSLSPDRSGTVTLTLFTTSDTCKRLTATYEILRSSGLLGAAPLTVTDPSGATLVVAAQAVLTERGENSLGLGENTRDFTFYCETMFDIALDEDIAKEVNDTLKGASIGL